MAQRPSALAPLLFETTFHYLSVQPRRLPPSENVSKLTKLLSLELRDSDGTESARLDPGNFRCYCSLCFVYFSFLNFCGESVIKHRISRINITKIPTSDLPPEAKIIFKQFEHWSHLRAL